MQLVGLSLRFFITRLQPQPDENEFDIGGTTDRDYPPSNYSSDHTHTGIKSRLAFPNTIGTVENNKWPVEAVAPESPRGTRSASMNGFTSAIRRCLMALVYFLTAARNRFILIGCAVTIATIYVLVTFDRSFLFGIGPFWANPIGPWLMDSTDTMTSGDLLDVLVGYRAFLHSGWHVPLFFVRDLGPFRHERPLPCCYPSGGAAG